MKHLLEYKKYAVLPKELRSMNLLYHSTPIDYFENIMKSNKLYGSDMYDTGIATSRNKHYAFSYADDVSSMHNEGNVQFILNRDKIKNICKIKAFDWEEFKSIKSKTGEYNDYHQAEDKIYCKDNTLKNLTDYIIGLHIVHNEYKEQVFKVLNDLKIDATGWFIFDENWKLLQ